MDLKGVQAKVENTHTHFAPESMSPKEIYLINSIFTFISLVKGR